MSDARRYAVWPDLRSRSWALQSWKSGHFQKLSPAPFTNGAGYWPRILKLGHNNWLGQIFIFVLVFVSRDLSFAQTSVVKSRPSVPYGANLLLFIFCCPVLYLLVQWPITSSVAAAAKGAVWPYTRHQCWRSWTWLTEMCVCVCLCCTQAGKSLLVPTPRPRTGILSQIQLPDDCDEETLSKYSTRQVDIAMSVMYNHHTHAHTQILDGWTQVDWNWLTIDPPVDWC